MIRINLRNSFGLFWIAWALAVVLIFVFGSAAKGGEGTVSKEAAATVESKEGPAKAFEVIRMVLQSPRCQNCHIPGDVPLQGDEGKPHGMNVKRGEDGRGKTAMRCTNCHQNKNGTLAHTPPGAFDWHLPPPSNPLVFINMPAGELCSHLKDPAKNGGKTPEQLMEHISKDRLVLWGWDPGPDRTKPPVSHEKFVTDFSKWVAAGLPCP
jgi:hypothetical protein